MVFNGLDDIIYRATTLGQIKDVDWSKITINSAAETNAGWHELFTAIGNPANGFLATDVGGEVVFPTTGTSAPKGMCAGVAGSNCIWAAYSGTNKIAKINTTTGETALFTSTISPVHVCLGADNRIWAVGSSYIAAYNPITGSETVYTPASGTGPTSICLGPDNLIWVTYQTNYKIAKWTTAGVETTYATTGTSAPWGICSDGVKLWVTYNATSKLAAWTTAGVETLYTPASGTGPDGCCLGPDGNIWVNYNTNHKIGKWNTSGTELNTYSCTGNAGPVDICSDGAALWVAYGYAGTNQVAKWTTAGVETVYPTTGSTTPYTPCLGGDNNVWVSYSSGNKVARFTVTGTAAGTATQLTSATQGALPLNAAVSPSTRHILNMQVLSNANLGTIILVDLLLYYPGLVVTGTPTTITNSATLPRYTDGVGVMGMMAVQSDFGAATPLLSLNITANNNSAQVATCIADANSLKQGQLMRSGSTAASGGPFLHIPSGLTGIKTLQSYTITSGGTTGKACFILFKPLMSISIPTAQQLSEAEYLNQFMSLPQIKDGACLAFLFGGTTALATTLIPFQGCLQYIYGP